MLEKMIDFLVKKLEHGSSLPWSSPDESPGRLKNERD